MKKNLLISLGVMVFLTVIVGFTAYNLTSRWTDLSEMVTKSISKTMLLEELSSSIDRQVRKVNVYVFNPSEELKDEIIDLNKDIIAYLKSLKIISNRASSEELNIDLVEKFYRNNIYPIVLQILDQKDSSSEKTDLPDLINRLDTHNQQIINQISTLKAFAIPKYEQDINQLKDYSKGVTVTITVVCVLLGIILMSISVNHFSTLYEQLEINLHKIKQINKELIDSNELNVKIQEDERLRIAQDLHDEVIQGLIGIIRKADNLNDDLGKSAIQNDIKLTISQIRRICQNLRPSILHDLGLHSAVEWLLEDLEKYGIVPNISIEENNYQKLSEKTELVIFRVIQELTNNIKKYSKATNAWLEIKYSNEGINILLKDDGCGFNYDEQDQSKTLGLIGIKERIKSVSGTIAINSKINEGTSVEIFIHRDSTQSRASGP